MGVDLRNHLFAPGLSPGWPALSQAVCATPRVFVSTTSRLHTICTARIEEGLVTRTGFLENATIRGLAWYKLLDAPVLTLDVTVFAGPAAASKRGSSHQNTHDLSTKFKEIYYTERSLVVMSK